MEEWRDIKDFENLYQVSNLGRIKSIQRNGTKGGIIAQFKTNNGYMKVNLHKNGNEYFMFVHRIVAVAFLPNQDNKPQINHKNGKKHDNRLVNLEWSTSAENLEHAIKNGLRHLKKVGQYKNGKLVAIYRSCNYASVKTNIQYATIYRCLMGIFKQAGGYEWRYID